MGEKDTSITDGTAALFVLLEFVFELVDSFDSNKSAQCCVLMLLGDGREEEDCKQRRSINHMQNGKKLSNLLLQVIQTRRGTK